MNIGIIGLGLIGGSLGRAIKKFTPHTVYTFDTDEEAMLKGELLSAYDKRLGDDDYKDIDLLIVALNPSATIEAMREACPKLKDGAIVTDTCGNKRVIVKEMKRLSCAYPNLKFVGVHPMAGREFSGVSHSVANLFERAYVIMVTVTPDMDALSRVKKLYLMLGAQDVEMCGAEKHDEMIAYTSQLAHIVSSGYVKNPHSSEHAGFSAGSFRDLTRVARLNPDMWTELFLQNRDNLIKDIEVLIDKLKEYDEALKNNDPTQLKALLEEGVRSKELAECARKERLK